MKKLQIRNSTAEFLIFTRQAGEDGIEVRVAEETVWLTQKLMAALFDVDVRTVNEHLGNIYQNGEQPREATIRNFRIVRLEGVREVARAVEHYNLDAIIAVGFRVNSARAIQFRQWATGGGCATMGLRPTRQPATNHLRPKVTNRTIPPPAGIRHLQPDGKI